MGKLFQIPAIELIVDTIFLADHLFIFFTSSVKASYYNYKQKRDYKRKSNFCNALPVAQNDGVTAVLVFAHTCTPPVLDVGGCTDSVSGTIDCNGTTNLQELFSAK